MAAVVERNALCTLRSTTFSAPCSSSLIYRNSEEWKDADGERLGNIRVVSPAPLGFARLTGVRQLMCRTRELDSRLVCPCVCLCKTWPGRSGVRNRWVWGFLDPLRPAPRSRQSTVQWVPFFPPGVKRPRRGVHPPPHFLRRGRGCVELCLYLPCLPAWHATGQLVPLYCNAYWWRLPTDNLV